MESAERAQNVSIQLHTVEGIPKEIPGVLVFSKCGHSQRRFPLCTRRAITDAFFWKSAVVFNWQFDLILEWLVYGFDGKKDIPLGRCRYHLNELLTTRKQAVESKKLRLIDDPSITICFSAELMPRPKLPDGSVALSVLKLPEFLQYMDSEAPLFNHDRLYHKSGTGEVPSIWLGMANPNDSRFVRESPDLDLKAGDENNTLQKPPHFSLSNEESENEASIFNPVYRRPHTLNNHRISGLKAKVKQKFGVILRRGDESSLSNESNDDYNEKGSVGKH